MAETRKRVTIGAEYSETYQSLLRVLGSGYMDDAGAHVERIGGRDVICTDSAEYVYDEYAAANSNGNLVVAMNRDGASWFAPVRRGMSFDDGMSEWKRLIYDVASAFHNKFSIIEYKTCDGSGNSDAEDTISRISRAAARLFSGNNAVVTKGVDRNKGSEDIYGASVKLELSGTGQSHYVVMCKIFFRATSMGVTPLSGEEAAQINARLEAAGDNDDPISLTSEQSIDINDKTLSAVSELIAGRYPVKFQQSLCFSTRQVLNPVTKKYEDNYDLKTYKFLARRAHANNASVTCTSVQVLGISHVKWINDYYEISFGGKTCVKVVVGFGGSLTMRCANCGGADLVSSNVITYSFTDEKGVTHDEQVTLDYSRDDLGISDDKLAEIRQYSEFANHLLSVKCEMKKRLNKSCVSCVCRSQTVNIGDIMKCADCPYPEVIYTDFSGDRPIKYLTGALTFAHDRLTMVLKENAGKCSNCGRTFTQDGLTGGRCKLCTEIENLEGERLENAKKLYRRYRNVFPQTVRIKHAAHKKYCVEDETTLVFALGNETYVLSKLDLTANGFVTKPQKIN